MDEISFQEEWVREAAVRAKKLEKHSWDYTQDNDTQISNLTAQTAEKRQLEKQVCGLAFSSPTWVELELGEEQTCVCPNSNRVAHVSSGSVLLLSPS